MRVGNKKSSIRLYCFSPPVMMATFIIESVLLLYVIFRFSLQTTLERIVVVIIACLAVFQLAEYNVCGRFNIDALTWSRIGFVAITLLPALGIHLVHEIAGIKKRTFVWFAYVMSIAWVYLFAFSSFAFNSHRCAGNYAIFQLARGVGGSYFAYYYALLFGAIFLAVISIDRVTKRRGQALKALVTGYAFFMVPTAITNTLKPETMQGIPSIMCGFAVLFAMLLVFYILPRGEAHRIP